MTKPKITDDQLYQEFKAAMRITSQIDEVGDCWIWTGATSTSGNSPIVHLAGIGCRLVRRVVYEMTGGKLYKNRPIGMKCGEPLCINPAHMYLSSNAEIAKIAGAQGKLSTVTKRAKIQQAAVNAGRTKLTPELAAIIRQSDESGAELGRRYGINRTLAARIKAGTAWREYKATPFSGLGAR